MKKYLLIFLVLIVALVALRLSAYTVSPTDYAYVTLLGKHVATYDGDVADEAGLHFGPPWPVQLVQRVDRRLQYLDLPSMELVTHSEQMEKQEDRLIVEGYVCWRIAGKDNVDLFIRRLGTMQNAEADLAQKINSQLGGLIQQRSTKDLINTDANRVEDTMKTIRTDLLARLGPKFEQEYGIDLVDVRVRRFSYSPQVRNDIFARIRSERNKEAEKHRSEGRKLAKDITSNAEKEAQILMAQASKQEKIIKGKADVEAARIRNEAHSKDPNFYIFLKKLDSLQQILGDNRTVLLLSSHRQIFDMLFQPPQGTPVGNRPGTDVSTKKKGNGSSSPAGP